MRSVKARLFWIISRLAHMIYSRVPFLGRIHGSLAIVRWEGGFLMIERNDGMGLGFPGGIRFFRSESPEAGVRREVTEETGLAVTSAKFLFSYRSDRIIPTETDVFEATVLYRQPHGAKHLFLPGENCHICVANR